MLTVEINPPQIDDLYLDALNTCFGHWGDQTAFDWVFRRRLSFPDTDRMILRQDGDTLLAGSGVTYRQLALPNGSTLDIGIMTGSWTLPAARRQGCFSRIIQESIERTRRHGGSLLIAFVTEDNASTRRLIAAGSALVPSHYLFTVPETPRPAPPAQLTTLEPDSGTVARLMEQTALVTADHVHFNYPAPADFVSQFIQRPDPTTILADARGNLAVIEAVGDTDRVQLFAPVSGSRENVEAFLGLLVARALAHNRKLFLFTTQEAVFQAAQTLGLGHKPGYITLLIADAARLWSALGTDAPPEPDPAPLVDAAHDLYLGAWQVHSGDRA